ncbi:hypothetical protein Ciccas_006590 [Cichlidogyrus casuarinus]|uniref:Dynein heavy chain tail domain-containing protein n=1 Tax=Cichlidogyrus casuarinus TaxID=1844966 RepID=A0ABD2Q5C4_9PLAT
MVKKRVVLAKYDPNEHWHKHHTVITNQYFKDSTNKNAPNMLLMHIKDEELRIYVNYLDPTAEHCFYVIKAFTTPEVFLTEKNFSTYVKYGNLNGSILESFLRSMQGVFVPVTLNKIQWPTNIKADYMLNLQRFMSALVDFRWRENGKTVLYLPHELENVTISDALRDKNLITRCEIVLIHWTKQIKEVLGNHNGQLGERSGGPLQEIDFWKMRAEDMAGITVQLNKPIIDKITTTLRTAKSAYVHAFLQLSEEILLNNKRAKSNLKFLETLSNVIYNLMDSKPSEVAAHLQPIISRIRCIWLTSEYYNSKEQITNLFQKLSNEILSICTKSLDLDDIFERRVKEAKKSLTECIDCCQNYEKVYLNTKHLHEAHSDIPWDLDEHTILAQIRAFVQRCQDLLQICHCTEHFCRYERDLESPTPWFRGVKGLEIAKGLENIKQLYEKQLYQLREYESIILNVKATSWHEGLDRFRIAIKEFEIMMQNLINLAFSQVKTVKHGIDLFELFAFLNSREAIKRTLENNANLLLNSYGEYLNMLRQDVNQYLSLPTRWPTEVRYSFPCRYWRLIKHQLESDMLLLENVYFVPSLLKNLPPYKEQCVHLIRNIDDQIKKIFIEYQNLVEPVCFQSHLLNPYFRISQKPTINSSCVEAIQMVQNLVAFFQTLLVSSSVIIRMSCFYSEFASQLHGVHRLDAIAFRITFFSHGPTTKVT